MIIDKILMTQFIHSIQLKFILVAVFFLLLCLSSITVLTSYQMSEIIQHKFKDIVAGFFFSVMADQTKAIAQDFQDGLHLVQREFVVGKKMFEFTNTNLNEEFATATNEFRVREGNTLASGGFTSFEWTWYAFPFANGSSPFYTLNAVQERDVQYCRNNHYFFKTMLDFPQLLINYDTYFLGFDSGVLCTRGNNPYFKLTSKNYSATYCNCDAKGNCYYSSVCRPWYVSQKKHPEQCYFSDLYLFAGGNSYGLGITSPLKEVNGTFAGAYNTNIVPSYAPNRIQLQGNYIKRMYFPDSDKSNYLISDNQPIWSPNWNMTSYSAYLQQVEDPSLKTIIQNFNVQHEFPKSYTKIAYFDWNLTKYAILMQNFSIYIEDFESPNKIPKDYTLGVMFESSLIEKKITAIQHKFLRTFLVLFMAPFLTMVSFFLICEMLFLVLFTRRIFSTINDLFDKIQMLSEQHSAKMKKKVSKSFIPGSTESLKTQEGLDQSVNYSDTNGLNASMNSRIARASYEATAKLDVLQDYQGKESCMEVTKLYRAANKLIKTLSLAKTSIQQGNDNLALLNYNEVANLFQERNIIQQSKTILKDFIEQKEEWSYVNQNDKTIDASQQQDDENGVKLIFKDLGLSNNLAICYNNIGCIHAKHRNKGKQNVYFQEAIRIEELIIKNNQLEKKCASIQDNMRIACKYFNFGYSLSRQYLFYVKMTAAGKLGYYFAKDQLGVESVDILKKSFMHFNSIQQSLTSEEQTANYAEDAVQQQIQRKRSLRDFGLKYDTDRVHNSLAKIHRDVFSYLLSGQYEEGSQGQSRHKGLWHFTQDILLQKLLYIIALFLEQRGTHFEQASNYYVWSICCPLMEQLEFNLMKKSLKKLHQYAQTSLEQQIKNKVQILLTKFAVKQKSVQIIVEMCNEQQHAHQAILGFISQQIFDNLRSNDFFGLMTLRSGKQPFAAINLERKHDNLKMKRSTLRQLNITYTRTENAATKYLMLTALQQCLRYCIDSASKVCPAQKIKRKNGEFISTLQNWVVAIVGQHQQELTKIEQYLKGTQQQSNINLIIIGVSIYDKELCDRYHTLCNMTPEGQFVNLNFNEQDEQISRLFDVNGKEENKDKKYDGLPSYERTFSRVQAAMQLFDSKREPYITQHIDFN
ncbi:hypothetical protein FGO68_gene15523 [Halteria grandinella]|uniref:Uncharacterized protein n=1 Tax=Halteria grandinella TaxID=5974 RepID=A0A8J8T8Z9_HALGN|nr:hypothetical protein FGO68_gene15523 [Halteria grandinella]